MLRPQRCFSATSMQALNNWFSSVSRGIKWHESYYDPFSFGVGKYNAVYGSRVYQCFCCFFYQTAVL